LIEAKTPRKKTKVTNKIRNWMSSEEIFTKSGRGDSEEQVTREQSSNITPLQYFESMFCSETISLIVRMSNLYALQRNHTLNLTFDEVKVYIAVLLLTGYLTPKYLRMFWETKDDAHNGLIANSIRRNRFFEIHKYLHLCDNMNLPTADKFGKVREYFKLLNSKFIENFKYVASTHISVDETMVPYYGRHSTKQHIHGKPLRFGYKVWSCATRLGYLVSFEPYQGAKSAQLPLQKEFGLGGAVVLEMQGRLPLDFGPYNIYFDNFFTSFRLISRLTELGIGGTGTIRENRLEKCPLEPSTSLKKKRRGSLSLKVTQDLSVVKWHDNSIVTVASNCHSLSPITTIDRIGSVNEKRTKIQVPCPNAVRQYNRYMGGVDRFDENLHSLRVSYRGKKWWFSLFAFGLDAACHNAWRIFKENTEGDFSYCEFRRNIVQVYCGLYGKKPKQNPARGTVSKRIPTEVRLDYDSEEHIREGCSQCRCAQCHQRTRIRCKKCKVGLHVHCWYSFHSKE
jgi:DNA excision repair protein ERCC-6